MSGKRFFDFEISELEQMPHEQAGRAIREVLRNKYPSWSEKNPLGNLPVAVIPESDAAIIGSKARVAVFSPDTLLKQKNHHPELTVEDYLKAQAAIDSGEKYQQTKKQLPM